MINIEDMVLQTNPEAPPSPFRLGTVAALFVNNTAQVLFDGETAASEKQYAYLSTYVPEVSDRVLLVNVGGTYIIMGDISFNVAPSPPEVPQNYLFDAQEVVMTQGLDVTGLLEAKSGAAVTGDLTVSEDITATGILSGASLSTGTATLTGALTVNGATNLKGATIDGAATVLGATVLKSSLEVDGDLNHDGLKIGFFGKNPVARPGGPSYATLSTSATLVQTIERLNVYINLLKGYGLSA